MSGGGWFFNDKKVAAPALLTYEQLVKKYWPRCNDSNYIGTYDIDNLFILRDGLAENEGRDNDFYEMEKKNFTLIALRNGDPSKVYKVQIEEIGNRFAYLVPLLNRRNEKVIAFLTEKEWNSSRLDKKFIEY